MGVKLGYRITIKPKNKKAKRFVHCGIVFKSYRDENGNQQFVPYRFVKTGKVEDVNSQESE